MNHPVLAEYLAVAAAVTAIDPDYTDQVRELITAERRVDFHIDAADALEDAALEDAADAARQRIHDKHQERWSEVSARIEAALPQPEVENAYRQLIDALS